MVPKISVVINTLNEEQNILRAIKSVSWADEIIVCDMYSDDNTAKIAKDLGAKVILHKRTGYVEPARNYAISKATNGWILILDADEEIPVTLAQKLQNIVKNMHEVNYVRVPRKNLIFGHFMQYSGWWPDYHIRLFRKSKVEWQDEIHSKPKTSGQGIKLSAEEGLAIVHHNYQTISQFIKRLNRYSDIQAKELQKSGVAFDWRDLIRKPLGEFLSRFFAEKGYLDGVHGLSLSLLQSFSFLVVYLKVWEMEKFKEQEINFSELKEETQVSGKAIEYWFKQENKGFLKKILKVFK